MWTINEHVQSRSTRGGDITFWNYVWTFLIIKMIFCIILLVPFDKNAELLACLLFCIFIIKHFELSCCWKSCLASTVNGFWFLRPVPHYGWDFLLSFSKCCPTSSVYLGQLSMKFFIAYSVNTIEKFYSCVLTSLLQNKSLKCRFNTVKLKAVTFISGSQQLHLTAPQSLWKHHIYSLNQSRSLNHLLCYLGRS